MKKAFQAVNKLSKLDKNNLSNIPKAFFSNNNNNNNDNTSKQEYRFGQGNGDGDINADAKDNLRDNFNKTDTNKNNNYISKFMTYDTSNPKNTVTHNHYNDERPKEAKEGITNLMEKYKEVIKDSSISDNRLEGYSNKHDTAMNNFSKAFEPIAINTSNEQNNNSYSKKDILTGMVLGGSLVAGGFLLNQHTSQLSGENSTDNFDNNDQIS